MTPHVLPWPDHLDAFEEWLRRTRDVLAGRDDPDAAVPQLTSVPDGPLPAALRLRAEAALQSLRAVEEDGARARVELARDAARSEAYGRY